MSKSTNSSNDRRRVPGVLAIPIVAFQLACPQWAPYAMADNPPVGAESPSTQAARSSSGSGVSAAGTPIGGAPAGGIPAGGPAPAGFPAGIPVGGAPAGTVPPGQKSPGKTNSYASKDSSSFLDRLLGQLTPNEASPALLQAILEASKRIAIDTDNENNKAARAAEAALDSLFSALSKHPELLPAYLSVVNSKNNVFIPDKDGQRVGNIGGNAFPHQVDSLIEKAKTGEPTERLLAAKLLAAIAGGAGKQNSKANPSKAGDYKDPTSLPVRAANALRDMAKNPNDVEMVINVLTSPASDWTDQAILNRTLGEILAAPDVSQALLNQGREYLRRELLSKSSPSALSAMQGLLALGDNRIPGDIASIAWNMRQEMLPELVSIKDKELATQLAIAMSIVLPQVTSKDNEKIDALLAGLGLLGHYDALNAIKAVHGTADRFSRNADTDERSQLLTQKALATLLKIALNSKSTQSPLISPLVQKWLKEKDINSRVLVPSDAHNSLLTPINLDATASSPDVPTLATFAFIQLNKNAVPNSPELQKLLNELVSQFRRSPAIQFFGRSILDYDLTREIPADARAALLAGTIKYGLGLNMSEESLLIQINNAFGKYSPEQVQGVVRMVSVLNTLDRSERSIITGSSKQIDLEAKLNDLASGSMPNTDVLLNPGDFATKFELARKSIEGNVNGAKSDEGIAEWQLLDSLDKLGKHITEQKPSLISKMSDAIGDMGRLELLLFNARTQSHLNSISSAEAGLDSRQKQVKTKLQRERNFLFAEKLGEFIDFTLDSKRQGAADLLAVDAFTYYPDAIGDAHYISGWIPVALSRLKNNGSAKLGPDLLKLLNLRVGAGTTTEQALKVLKNIDPDARYHDTELALFLSLTAIQSDETWQKMYEAEKKFKGHLLVLTNLFEKLPKGDLSLSLIENIQNRLDSIDKILLNEDGNGLTADEITRLEKLKNDLIAVANSKVFQTPDRQPKQKQLEVMIKSIETMLSLLQSDPFSDEATLNEIEQLEAQLQSVRANTFTVVSPILATFAQNKSEYLLTILNKMQDSNVWDKDRSNLEVLKKELINMLNSSFAKDNEAIRARSYLNGLIDTIEEALKVEQGPSGSKDHLYKLEALIRRVEKERKIIDDWFTFQPGENLSAARDRIRTELNSEVLKLNSRKSRENTLRLIQYLRENAKDPATLKTWLKKDGLEIATKIGALASILASLSFIEAPPAVMIIFEAIAVLVADKTGPLFSDLLRVNFLGSSPQTKFLMYLSDQPIVHPNGVKQDITLLEAIPNPNEAAQDTAVNIFTFGLMRLGALGLKSTFPNFFKDTAIEPVKKGVLATWATRFTHNYGGLTKFTVAESMMHKLPGASWIKDKVGPEWDSLIHSIVLGAYFAAKHTGKSRDGKTETHAERVERLTRAFDKIARGEIPTLQELGIKSLSPDEIAEYKRISRELETKFNNVTGPNQKNLSDPGKKQQPTTTLNDPYSNLPDNTRRAFRLIDDAFAAREAMAIVDEAAANSRLAEVFSKIDAAFAKSKSGQVVDSSAERRTADSEDLSANTPRTRFINDPIRFLESELESLASERADWRRVKKSLNKRIEKYRKDIAKLEGKRDKASPAERIIIDSELAELQKQVQGVNERIDRLDEKISEYTDPIVNNLRLQIQEILRPIQALERPTTDVHEVRTQPYNNEEVNRLKLAAAEKLRDLNWALQLEAFGRMPTGTFLTKGGKITVGENVDADTFDVLHKILSEKTSGYKGAEFQLLNDSDSGRLGKFDRTAGIPIINRNGYGAIVNPMQLRRTVYHEASGHGRHYRWLQKASPEAIRELRQFLSAGRQKLLDSPFLSPAEKSDLLKYWDRLERGEYISAKENYLAYLVCEPEIMAAFGEIRGFQDYFLSEDIGTTNHLKLYPELIERLKALNSERYSVMQLMDLNNAFNNLGRLGLYNDWRGGSTPDEIAYRNQFGYGWQSGGTVYKPRPAIGYDVSNSRSVAPESVNTADATRSRISKPATESQRLLSRPAGTTTSDTFHDPGLHRNLTLSGILKGLRGIVETRQIYGFTDKGGQVSQNAGPTNWESPITIRIKKGTPEKLAKQSQSFAPDGETTDIYRWFATGGTGRPINIDGFDLEVIVNGNSIAEVNARIKLAQKAVAEANSARVAQGLKPVNVEVKSINEFLTERFAELSQLLPKNMQSDFIDGMANSSLEARKAVGELSGRMTPDQFVDAVLKGWPNAHEWARAQAQAHLGPDGPRLFEQYLQTRSLGEEIRILETFRTGRSLDMKLTKDRLLGQIMDVIAPKSPGSNGTNGKTSSNGTNGNKSNVLDSNKSTSSLKLPGNSNQAILLPKSGSDPAFSNPNYDWKFYFTGDGAMVTTGNLRTQQLLDKKPGCS